MPRRRADAELSPYTRGSNALCHLSLGPQPFRLRVRMATARSSFLRLLRLFRQRLLLFMYHRGRKKGLPDGLAHEAGDSQVGPAAISRRWSSRALPRLGFMLRTARDERRCRGSLRFVTMPRAAGGSVELLAVVYTSDHAQYTAIVRSKMHQRPASQDESG